MESVEKTKQTEYTVGSLRYTLPKLLLTATVLLMARIILAVVCYWLVPNVKTILLDRAGATSAQIALIIGTIPSFLNAILVPIISTFSDRTRTRWGRRTPYLLYSAPVLAILVIVIGFSGDISHFLQKIFPFLQGNTQLWVLGIAVMLFQIAYLFPGTTVYYLEADIIPQICIGRYMAIGSMVNSVLMAGLSYFVLSYALEHVRTSLTIFAAIYLLCYILQFFFAKEGEYPPVEKMTDDKQSLPRRTVQFVVTFFRECFSQKIYIYLAVCMGLNSASNICRGMYNMLFATKELGVSYSFYGKISSISSLICAGLIYFFGKIMDKTHPMLIYFVGGLLVMGVNVFGYFFVYANTTTYQIHSHAFTYAELSYSIVAIVVSMMYSFQGLANTPLLIKILPMDKFGQFASGNAMVNHISLMIGAFLGGIVTQHFGYRVMFIWDFFVTGLASLALVGVYYEWKRLGGKNYVAP